MHLTANGIEPDCQPVPTTPFPTAKDLESCASHCLKATCQYTKLNTYDTAQSSTSMPQCWTYPYCPTKQVASTTQTFALYSRDALPPSPPPPPFPPPPPSLASVCTKSYNSYRQEIWGPQCSPTESGFSANHIRDEMCKIPGIQFSILCDNPDN